MLLLFNTPHQFPPPNIRFVFLVIQESGNEDAHQIDGKALLFSTVTLTFSSATDIKFFLKYLIIQSLQLQPFNLLRNKPNAFIQSNITRLFKEEKILFLLAFAFPHIFLTHLHHLHR